MAAPVHERPYAEGQDTTEPFFIEQPADDERPLDVSAATEMTTAPAVVSDETAPLDDGSSSKVLELIAQRNIRRYIAAVALRHGAPENDIDDIVQATMYKAWRNPNWFEGTKNWTVPISVMARTATIDFWRSRTKKGTAPEPLLVDRFEAGEFNTLGYGIDLSDPDSDFPTRLAEQDKAQQVLAGAMEQLRDTHREVIQLRYFYNMADKDISMALGIPLGTVKSRLSYATQNLRDILAQQGIDSMDSLQQAA